MIELIRKQILGVKKKRIIEFGTGYYEPFHSDISVNNDLTLTDINEVRGRPKDIKCNIIIADACETGFEESCFDVAFSSMLIPYVDLGRHFREVERILKPKGVYWFACTGPKHNLEIQEPSLQRLNTNPENVVKLGARIIREELYKERYSRESLALYYKKIGIDNESYGHVINIDITKNYLLFELHR